MRTAHFALLLLLSLEGCSSAPAQPAAPPASAAPSAAPATSAASDVSVSPALEAGPSTPLAAACARLRRKNEEQIGQAQRGPAPLDEDIAGELRKVEACIPAGSGAWAVRIVSLMSLATPVVESSGSVIQLNLGIGGLEVVFVDANGVVPEVGDGHVLGITSFGNLSFNRITTFDYDADGTPEFGLCLAAGGGNLDQEYEWECALLAWKKGSIQPYGGAPAGASIRDIEDIDADGRPDILSMGPFEAPCDDPAKSPCVDPPVAGPAGFLYHALPDGTLTPSDDVARAHAVKQFPYDLRALFEHDAPPTGSDVRTLRGMGANAVRGALAFGEDRKKIRAALARPRQGYCADPKRCPFFDAMESWPVSPFWPNGPAKPSR